MVSRFAGEIVSFGLPLPASEAHRPRESIGKEPMVLSNPSQSKALRGVISVLTFGETCGCKARFEKV